MPAGWEPEGTLDARERTIAGQVELVLDLGGVEVSVPQSVTQRRGLRGALLVTATNPSGVDRELTISVAGPVGMRVPERTVPLRGGATLTF